MPLTYEYSKSQHTVNKPSFKQATRSHPEMVGDMSHVTLNFEL